MLFLYSGLAAVVAPAAEHLRQIAHAQRGADGPAVGEAPVGTGLTAVGRLAVFHLPEGLEILHVVRLHAHRPADVLHGGDLVAQAVVGQGAEVIPPGGAVLGRGKHVQRLLVPAVDDVLVGRAEIGIPLFLLAVGPLVATEGAVAAKGVVPAVPAIAAGTTAGGLGLLRVLDLLIGGVDLLHLLGGHRVAGVPVRMVLHHQLPVGMLDLLIRGVGADA